MTHHATESRLVAPCNHAPVFPGRRTCTQSGRAFRSVAQKKKSYNRQQHKQAHKTPTALCVRCGDTIKQQAWPWEDAFVLYVNPVNGPQ